MKEHKIVVVTPAGRRHYLELLKHYILLDDGIDEWHLWDNCRNPKDREYIEDLAKQEPKIKVVKINGADGTNKSVNRFYPFCTAEDTFFIKLDDDVVYLSPNFSTSVYEAAMKEKGRYIWWSPLVVNNAVCTWLLKYHSKIGIEEPISCQASDDFSWKSPSFAIKLHEIFLKAMGEKRVDEFKVPDFEVSLSRFSINCLGYFGEDVRALGETFCPSGVDDEEWISAVLPSRIGKPGRVIGSVVISHFAFYTQEQDLLRAKVLEKYYNAAFLQPEPYPLKPLPIKRRIKDFARKSRNLLRTPFA
ncbi:MAG: glycosyltransferase family 2 protein [Fibrobacterota bacterium]|nr:glycosyltransferase family 2 protein [Fibrobacterota bacterium]QQS06342.1 MAG: glycosyltransferase family 2 protein [Fibrobacterota bacterium]